MKYLHRYGGMMVGLCLFCIMGVQTWAQEENIASEEPPLEFILHPVQEGFYSTLRRFDRSAEVAFKKEPEYAGDAVRRDPLWFGGGQTDFIGVAYDVTANKLYIDRNRNLDLTDDGPPVEASEPGRFYGIMIEMIHGEVSVRYAVDINYYGGSYFYPVLRGGWKGEIEIAGKPCVMGIADKLDGVFDDNDLFLFDHERNREARLSYGEEDILSLPQWLYFEGQSYRLACEFRVADEETVIAVTLTPITEGLMDITFEGQFVSRVILYNRDEDKKDYGWLDWPPPVMRIPQGTYSVSRVDLLDSFYGYPRHTIRLAAEETARLQAGGPLQQKASARRAGGRLVLDSMLQGIDGIQYNPDLRHKNRAAFAVYKGDRKLCAAQFEYG